MLHLQPRRDVSPFADDEPTERWADDPLNEAQRELIIDYLRSRQESRDDWISFHKPPDYEVAKGLRELGLDPASR